VKGRLGYVIIIISKTMKDAFCLRLQCVALGGEGGKRGDGLV